MKKDRKFEEETTYYHHNNTANNGSANSSNRRRSRSIILQGAKEGYFGQFPMQCLILTIYEE